MSTTYRPTCKSCPHVVYCTARWVAIVGHANAVDSEGLAKETHQSIMTKLRIQHGYRACGWYRRSIERQKFEGTRSGTSLVSPPPLNVPPKIKYILRQTMPALIRQITKWQGDSLGILPWHAAYWRAQAQTRDALLPSYGDLF